MNDQFTVLSAGGASTNQVVAFYNRLLTPVKLTYMEWFVCKSSSWNPICTANLVATKQINRFCYSGTCLQS